MSGNIEKHFYFYYSYWDDTDGWRPPSWKTRTCLFCHYSDVIMTMMASKITSLTIVYSTVYSGADLRKHRSSVSLAFVRGFHPWPVNSPHKWPTKRNMFPFDDVIMAIAPAAKILTQFSRSIPASVPERLNEITDTETIIRFPQYKWLSPKKHRKIRH